MRLIITPEDRVIEPAQELVRKYREIEGLLEFVETILAYKLKHLSREEIAGMFTMGDLKQTRVYQDAYGEALAKGIEQGIEQGIQRGLERGRQEGEARAILRLLSRKFGSLSPQLTQQITSLSAESLDQLADVIWDMQSLDELVAWLSNH